MGITAGSVCERVPLGTTTSINTGAGSPATISAALVGAVGGRERDLVGTCLMTWSLPSPFLSFSHSSKLVPMAKTITIASVDRAVHQSAATDH